MKRIGLILFAATFGLILFGCQQEDKPEPTKPDADKLKAAESKAPETKAAPRGGGGMPPATPSGLDATK